MPLPPDQGGESDHAHVWTPFHDELERTPGDEGPTSEDEVEKHLRDDGQGSEEEVEQDLRDLSKDESHSADDSGDEVIPTLTSVDGPSTSSSADDSRVATTSVDDSILLLQKWRGFVDRVFENVSSVSTPGVKDAEARQKFLTDYRALLKEKAGSMTSVIFRKKVASAWSAYKKVHPNSKTRAISTTTASSLCTWMDGLRAFSVGEWGRQAQVRGGILPPDGHLFFKGCNTSFSRLTPMVVEEEMRMKICAPWVPVNQKTGLTMTSAEIATALAQKFDAQVQTVPVAAGPELSDLVASACRRIVRTHEYDEVNGLWFRLRLSALRSNTTEVAVAAGLESVSFAVMGILAELGLRGWPWRELPIAYAGQSIPALAPVDPLNIPGQVGIIRHTIGTTFSGRPDLVFFSLTNEKKAQKHATTDPFFGEVRDLYGIGQHPSVTEYRKNATDGDPRICFLEAKSPERKLEDNVAQASGQALIGLIKLQHSFDAVADGLAPLNLLDRGATWVLTNGESFQFGTVLPLPLNHPLRIDHGPFLWKSTSLLKISVLLKNEEPDVEGLKTMMTMLVLWCSCEAAVLNSWLSEILGADEYEG